MDEKAPMTMKDIAKEFGISVATVSRALKDSPRISEERRKAIQFLIIHDAKVLKKTHIKHFL